MIIQIQVSDDIKDLLPFVKQVDGVYLVDEQIQEAALCLKGYHLPEKNGSIPERVQYMKNLVKMAISRVEDVDLFDDNPLTVLVKVPRILERHLPENLVVGDAKIFLASLDTDSVMNAEGTMLEKAKFWQKKYKELQNTKVYKNKMPVYDKKEYKQAKVGDLIEINGKTYEIKTPPTAPNKEILARVKEMFNNKEKKIFKEIKDQKPLNQHERNYMLKFFLEELNYPISYMEAKTQYNGYMSKILN